MISVPLEIISKYDIRASVISHLSSECFFNIGMLVGDYILQNGLEKEIAIGIDKRPSSLLFCDALCNGLMLLGIDVVRVDSASTPIMYFCTRVLRYDFAIMITGSHNSIDYNGLKMFQKGKILLQTDLTAILTARNILPQSNPGRLIESTKETSSYFSHLSQSVSFDFKRQETSVIWDYNPSPSLSIRDFLCLENSNKNILINSISIPTDSSCTFEFNTKERLDFIKSSIVQMGTSVAFAFDYDFDRLYVFDEFGRKLSVHEILQLLFLALEIPPNSTVLVDTKASNGTITFLRQAGCNVVFSDPGHSVMKANMEKTGSVFGVEESHHFYFKHFCNYSDDAVFFALQILKLLESTKSSPGKLLYHEFKWSKFSSRRFFLPSEEYLNVIEKIQTTASAHNLKYIKSEGIRVYDDHFWLLFRKSNTEGFVSFIGESKNILATKKIKMFLSKVFPFSELELKDNYASQ